MIYIYSSRSTKARIWAVCTICTAAQYPLTLQGLTIKYKVKILVALSSLVVSVLAWVQTWPTAMDFKGD
jgi:hypothetical protein